MMQSPNTDAIVSLRPGARWVMQNDDLAELVWLDQVQTRPTDSEIAAEVARMAAVGQVPASISRRQFFHMLAVLNIISQTDAINAVKTGTIPVTLQALINSLPADKQFDATMLIIGEAVFHRNNWLSLAIGTAYGWSATQIDQFFQAAAAL